MYRCFEHWKPHIEAENVSLSLAAKLFAFYGSPTICNTAKRHLQVVETARDCDSDRSGTNMLSYLG